MKREQMCDRRRAMSGNGWIKGNNSASVVSIKIPSDWAGEKQEISEPTTLIAKLHTTAVMLKLLLPTEGTPWWHPRGRTQGHLSPFVQSLGRCSQIQQVSSQPKTPSMCELESLIRLKAQHNSYELHQMFFSSTVTKEQRHQSKTRRNKQQQKCVNCEKSVCCSFVTEVWLPTCFSSFCCIRLALSSSTPLQRKRRNFSYKEVRDFTRIHL